MKKLWLTSVVLAAGLAFSGAANAQIKLGVAGPITGPNAAFGAQLKNGTEHCRPATAVPSSAWPACCGLSAFHLPAPATCRTAWSSIRTRPCCSRWRR